MTKQTIRQDLHINWIAAISDKSCEEAVQWLAQNVPANAVLEVMCEYEYVYGVAYIAREETSEEYDERISDEEAREAKREEARVNAAMLLQNKIAILKSQDIALSSYLEKHKNNPGIGDLENLYIALTQAPFHGNIAVQELKDCMKRLENYDE